MTYPTPDTGYGTREHEDWLIEQEREDDRWGPEPIPSTIPYYDGPGCACTVRIVFGGDCQHSVAAEEAYFAQEDRRARDLDDGLVWDDDH